MNLERADKGCEIRRAGQGREKESNLVFFRGVHGDVSVEQS